MLSVPITTTSVSFGRVLPSIVMWITGIACSVIVSIGVWQLSKLRQRQVDLAVDGFAEVVQVKVELRKGGRRTQERSLRRGDRHYERVLAIVRRALGRPLEEGLYTAKHEGDIKMVRRDGSEMWIAVCRHVVYYNGNAYSIPDDDYEVLQGLVSTTQ